MVKEEALKNTANIRHDTIFEDNDYPNNVNLLYPPTPLLTLKIRNTKISKLASIDIKTR
jgi:hypothetical protein